MRVATNESACSCEKPTAVRVENSSCNATEATNIGDDESMASGTPRLYLKEPWSCDVWVLVIRVVLFLASNIVQQSKLPPKMFAVSRSL